MQTLTRRTARLDRRQRDDHKRLARELADTRKQLERLHLGGLVLEAWGAALIATGIAVNAWAGWIAATPVAQAVLLVWTVGAIGWGLARQRTRRAAHRAAHAPAHGPGSLPTVSDP